MKTLPVALSLLTEPQRRRNLLVLAKLVVVFFGLVLTYTILFHALMLHEGQEHSWITGFYWTLTVMSTLGFGDITFHSDVGRLFSVFVLLSGTVFMLVLLPFMFIQFFYVPWMEEQAAARAPRSLPSNTRDHVVLTNLSPVEVALVRLLDRSKIPYVLIVEELDEALRLYDQGFRVMVGDLDDQETYVRARAGQATLVLTARTDTANTNVAFTVRESSLSVMIVATATAPASVDILELAGCNHVLQLGEMLGQALARRVFGRDAHCHVIGEFGDLLIAEASAAQTPLVGRTLQEIRLRDHANVSVVGVWDRGSFQFAGPETVIQPTSVLILAGNQQQLDSYNSLFCIYQGTDAQVIIIGGGRVGRAVAKSLMEQGIDYRIIEKRPERVRDQTKYVLGDAAELEVLQQAGIDNASSVVITTHDDDVNVYLTIYCRRLRPDVQILGRANLERNVSTLHRAGADFVMSYASSGANIIFNMLQKGDLLLLAEGLDAFRLPMPESLVGRTLAESAIRQSTGCNVIGIVQDEECNANPDAHQQLPAGADLVLIGDLESEQLFLEKYVD